MIVNPTIHLTSLKWVLTAEKVVWISQPRSQGFSTPALPSAEKSPGNEVDGYQCLPGSMILIIFVFADHVLYSGVSARSFRD